MQEGAAMCSNAQLDIALKWQMSGSRLGVFQEKTAPHRQTCSHCGKHIKDHKGTLQNLKISSQSPQSCLSKFLGLSRSKYKTAKKLSGLRGLDFLRVVSGFWSSMPWCESLHIATRGKHVENTFLKSLPKTSCGVNAM